MNDDRSKSHDNTCLSQEEIESYTYLLVTGARLQPENELNARTEGHLECCEGCQERADKSFKEAGQAIVNLYRHNLGSCESRLLMDVIAYSTSSSPARIAILEALKELLVSADTKLNPNFVGCLRKAAKDTDLAVRAAANEVLCAYKDQEVQRDLSA